MKDRLTAMISLVKMSDAAKKLFAVMSQGKCPSVDMAPVSGTTSDIPVHVWI